MDRERLSRPLIFEGVRVIPIDEVQTDVKIAVARDERELARRQDQIQRINGQYPISESRLEDRTVLISGKDIDVFNEPQPSRSLHRKSGALYIARSRFHSPAVQIYYLPEKILSSFHYHRICSEDFFMIDGNAIGEFTDEKFPVPRQLSLPPWTPHRVTAEEGGAVITVVTRGMEDCFAMDDHHYVESYEDFARNHLPQRPLELRKQTPLSKPAHI